MAPQLPRDRKADDAAQGLASPARFAGSPPFARPKRDDVRAALLASAAETFIDDGYERASLARIAARAGFTKGAIYSNFGSKPELFLAAWDEHVRQRQSAAIERLARDAAAAPSIDALLDSLSTRLASLIPSFEPWEALVAQVRMLACEDPEISRLYQRIYAERIEGILAAIRSHDLLAGLAEEKLQVFAVALLSLMNVLCLENAAQPEATCPERSAALFRYCLEGALR